MLGELFDASMPAVAFAVTSMALGYAAFGVCQTAVLSSASNDIPRVGGHGNNRRKQRFKLLFESLCRNRSFSVFIGKGASTDAKASHSEISNKFMAVRAKRSCPWPTL